MAYHIKEIFLTLQGEGAQSGRAAVFCRFTGCNLWSGLEKDRATAACRFCDTDFVKTDGVRGGRYTADSLSDTLLRVWSDDNISGGIPYVVFTGGEPLLQLDESLIQACKRKGFEVAIETNGTKIPPPGIDWVCVSPKPRAEQCLTSGDEIKLIFPQEEPEMSPERFLMQDFKHWFLQPMDGPNQLENVQATAAYCQSHPQWRLSLQMHKLIGLP